MSDYDNRQYRLIAERIVQYEKASFGLKHLIADLDALLCALQQADGNWKAAFQKQWSVLEEVYEVALDRGKGLNKDNTKLIDSALDSMRRLLKQVHAEHDVP
jgi:hypothetical protein